MAVRTLVVGRLKRVKKNPCPECFGDGLGVRALHLGMGVWAGQMCSRCNGTGKRKEGADGR